MSKIKRNFSDVKFLQSIAPCVYPSLEWEESAQADLDEIKALSNNDFNTWYNNEKNRLTNLITIKNKQKKSVDETNHYKKIIDYIESLKKSRENN